ncbi:MAG: UDP-N-acetylmuramoyl-L-alanine--D-glutamate ligase [Microthrixaceae bacterium]
MTAGPPPVEHRVLVFGLGVTNVAAARALVAHGHEVVLADDRRPAAAEPLAAELGAPLLVAPDHGALGAAVANADAVLPAPGLPWTHPLFDLAAAAGRPVLSEFDLAAAWDHRPLVAVTGTNGKTTVTLSIAAMLDASGLATEAVGNLEVPLVAAIEDPGPEWFVVEASSFRLAHSRWFRPRVAVWLNFAEDHLDVHRDLGDYRAAKARIFADQGPDDTAVVNAEDPVVAAAEPARPDGPRVLRFGLAATDPMGRAVEYHQDADRLVGPSGAFAEVGDLWRDLPHDRANALAAAAAASAAGASLDGVRSALRRGAGLPHRVELVGERDGVSWYDDSKATAPHATLAAIGGFDSVVLVAGGRNKGLDLGALAAAAPRVRAVVGIGEAAPEVLAAFPDRPGRAVTSMAEAVEVAAALARPGDTVLLSPGCASFDWYGSYAERGDDFAAQVRRLVLRVPA